MVEFSTKQHCQDYDCPHISQPAIRKLLFNNPGIEAILLWSWYLEVPKSWLWLSLSESEGLRRGNKKNQNCQQRDFINFTAGMVGSVFAVLIPLRILSSVTASIYHRFPSSCSALLTAYVGLLASSDYETRRKITVSHSDTNTSFQLFSLRSQQHKPWHSLFTQNYIKHQFKKADSSGF